MTKLNVRNLENLEQVKDIMDMWEFIDENENFIDEDHFSWWQNLANQMKYLEDLGVDMTYMDFDDIGRAYMQITSE